MSNKSPQKNGLKKQGKSLKEKRVAKEAKREQKRRDSE